MKSISHRLADFSHGISWAEMPEKVRKEAVRALLNYVGCALGGSNTPAARAAIKGLQRISGAPKAAVLGSSIRLDPVNAAVANCLSSAAHTYDDTHLETITHPTGPIAAAILAFADTEVISGEQALAALVVGMEIECRMSVAITARGSGAHGGWYITGVSGGIGAAAAISRLMRLSHEQTVSAIGLATTQACGLRSTHGSMAIAYVPGLAARNGLTAAYMAAEGLVCGDIAIDGRNGLLEVLAPNARAETIDHEIGGRFEMLNNAFKPYPCGIVIHPAIDACLQISGEGNFNPEAIKKVEVFVHPDAMRLTWRKLPETEPDAQVSVFHWIAAALIFRAAGLAQSEQSAILNPRVRALQNSITVTVDPEVMNDQARVAVFMSNGQVLRAKVEHATGSIARPMTEEELDLKFINLSTRVLTDSAASDLVRVCRNIGDCPDVSKISKDAVKGLRATSV